jgi:hypothetical protein
MVSSFTPTSQPTWLIEGDHQNTFNTAEEAAAKLAAAAIAPAPKAMLTAGLLTPTLRLPP